MRYLPKGLPPKYCLRWPVSHPCSEWEGVVPGRSKDREISNLEPCPQCLRIAYAGGLLFKKRIEGLP